MKHLNKKLGRTGGFTLIEMLIVVAIIAILIAVSIPMVNSSLEAARDAADQANERSAKAAAIMVYMGVAEVEDHFTTDTGGSSGGQGGAEGDGTNDRRADITYSGSTIYYDAAKGILTTDDTTIAAYGKCTEDCTEGAGKDKFEGITVVKPPFQSQIGSEIESGEKEAASHVGRILRVYVSDGEVVLMWEFPPVLSLLG